MKEKIVIALGGNAIQSDVPTAQAQQQAIHETLDVLKPLFLSDYQIVLTHGNGPQIGNILIQQYAAASKKTPPMPLDVCGAMSQGMIGYWMQSEVNALLTRNHVNSTAVTVLTEVEVSQDDQAFKHPTKPIGPFYTKEEAEQIQKNEPGSHFKEDAGRGYRKVVASPIPKSILEYDTIKSLIDAGNTVIACGGGGIPVIRDGDDFKGVEGVIDKDFASSLLASMIEADTLMILTGVEYVYVNYQKPDEEKLSDVTVEELQKYIERGDFAEGSMLPKIQAAIEFIKEDPNKRVIITNLEKAYEAVENNAGTHIHL